MKNIFIDLTALSRKRTGIENYTFNIVSQLILLDAKNTYTLLFRIEIDSVFLSLKREKVKLCLSPFKSQLLTEQLYIPFFILLQKFDINFFPCFPPSWVLSKKLFVICYDATMWKYKETLSLKNKFYFKPLSTRALKISEKVFTISESSRRDIVQIFPEINFKLINLGTAMSESFEKVPEEEANLQIQKLGISKPYLLCVGSLEPRKNIPFILRNVSQLIVRRDLMLVLVGRKAWGSNSIDNEIEQLNIKDRILKTGYVSNFDLRCLYSKARAFLFPSIYEGFGIPILEAFACGCPVVTSRVSSMPEVAGNAALLIDPTKGDELVTAISQILDSEILRHDLIKKGLERLKNFSWNNCAQILLDAF